MGRIGASLDPGRATRLLNKALSVVPLKLPGRYFTGAPHIKLSPVQQKALEGRAAGPVCVGGCCVVWLCVLVVCGVLCGCVWWWAVVCVCVHTVCGVIRSAPVCVCVCVG